MAVLSESSAEPVSNWQQGLRSLWHLSRKNQFLNDKKIVVPIISQGDPIGSITILPKENRSLGDTELKIAEVGASFLAKQMENWTPCPPIYRELLPQA